MMRMVLVKPARWLAAVASLACVMSVAHAQAPQVGAAPAALAAASAPSAPPPAARDPRAGAKLAYDSASGLSGYKRADGTWAIEPRYKNASEFSGGLAFVELPDGSGGLIDEKGAMVVPNVQQALWVSEPTMTEAGFSEGLIAARDMPSNKVGFVDAQGRWVIRPRFADAHEFHEGLAAFRMTERGKIGFIDKRGRIVIPARYGSNFRAPPVFSEGLAAVGLNDNWPRTNLDPPGKLGYIDAQGRWVIAPKYSAGKPFVDGKAVVMMGEKEFVLERPGNR